MKLHPDDPRLTAYLMGELSADEAAAVEREVAADPALQSALQELDLVRRILAETLAPTADSLSPGHRENIRRAARQAALAHPSPGNTATRLRSWKPWVAALAAAAAITLVAIVATSKSNLSKRWFASKPPASQTAPPDEQSLRAKLSPAPGPADSGTAEAMALSPKTDSALPPLRTRGSLAAADFPTLELPIQSGKSSLGWIRESIRAKHQLPDHNAVRLEEILNSFPLRLTGVTVVVRSPATGWHPDDRSSGMTSHAATMETESIVCPWKPSASLVLISIRGNEYSDCEIKALYHAGSSRVRQYRLLGFSPVEGRPTAPLPTRLPAKSTISLAIEIEPSSVTGDLGAIEWSVNGQAAPSVALTRREDAEPSNDARFAALVCAYSQWLAGQAPALIDADLVAALARENAAATLPADRADFLSLIDQSLKL